MIEGKIWKDDKFWLAEIPALDYLTQGRTRVEALKMAKDIVITGVEKKGFDVLVVKGKNGAFTLMCNDTNAILAHMLKRQRQKYGLTVREVSARLKSSSPNAFSVYERGKSAPTISKLEELVNAINSKSCLVLSIA